MLALSRPPCDRGLVQAVTADAGLSRARRRWVLFASVLGSSIAFIDGSVVGVALPAIQRELSAGAAAAQWIVDAYLLTLGALVLVGGAAADRFGRRRVFLTGIAIFTVSSVACGLALGAGMLVAARALQGLGAALLTPSSLALLGAAFPEDERGRAFGAWAGAASLTAALGPALGGWLTDVVSWRAVFLINVPIAIVAVLATLRFVPESRDPDAAQLDGAGAALVVSGLGITTWAFIAAPDRGIDHPTVVGALLSGVALSIGFAVLEARSGHPMMPPSLFRSRTFAGANLLTLLLYFALGGALFLLPFDLIGAQGYSATQAGAALIPFSVVMGVFSRSAGRLADRIGARAPLAGGAILAGAGLVLVGLTPRGAPYVTGLLPAVLVLAVGMTLAVAPLTSTVIGAVEPHRVGVASGVNNAVARIAGLLAVAVLGAVLSAVFARLAVASGVPPDEVRARLARVMAGEPVLGAEALRDSFHDAFAIVMWGAGACAAAGGLSVLATIPRRHARA